MKKQKTLTRILLLALALSMMLVCFVGCKGDGPDEGTENNSVSTNGGNTGDDELGDSLPDDLNYNDTVVTIYGWQSTVTEFEVEEYNGIAIDQAVYDRNKTVESRLGVKLDYEIFPSGDSNKYPTEVELHTSGGEAYDIYAGHTRMNALCTTKGLFLNLGGIENSYLDFDKPWWNKSVIEKTSIGNNFYICTGDIAPSSVQMVYCIYFNEDMITNEHLDNPYDLVADNEWTLENMLAMNMNFYQDDNTNNIADIGDHLPLVGANWDWPALLHGCGIGIVDTDVTGEFVLNSDFIGEKSINVMEMLEDTIALDNSFVNNSDGDTRNSFMNEKSLFLITQSGLAATHFSDIEFQYGAVPCPKYDSEQENYISTARQTVTMYSLSKAVATDRLPMITAVMECLAVEGYNQVTPVVFDTVMKYQKSASADMSDMLQLIRETAWFDMGRIYTNDLSIISDRPGMLLRDGQSWATYLDGTVKTTVKNQLQKLSDDLVGFAQ